MNQYQTRFSYKGRAHITYTRDILEHLAQVIRKIVSLRFTRHLLHKATIPRLEDIADLPNTQRQTQKGKMRQRNMP